MASHIQLRRGTAAQWIAANPVLAEGEQGLEKDTGKTKIGDGMTPWNTLSYPAGNGTVVSVTGEGVVKVATGGTMPVISILEDAEHRFATDAEKSSWSGKQPALGFTPVNAASIGQAGGLTPLDGSGKVAAIYLPAYVDDVLEVANYAALPATGETGKIYTTLDDNKIYRWGGSAYVTIAASPGSTDAVTEGATNLYFNAARVRSTILAGLSLAAGTVVDATHSVLQAIGFLQKQASDNATAIAGKQAALVSGTNLRTVNGNTLLGSTDLTISAAPVGSATELQYRNGAIFGGMSGTAWDDVTRSLALTGATVTASKPMLDFSQSWNNAAVAFTGIRFNIPSAVCSSASLLMDLQVGGVSRFKATVDGNLSLAGFMQCASIGASGNVGIASASGFLYLNDGGLRLYYDAANILAQRNGTAAQTSNVYGTYTDASNYRRIALAMTAAGVATLKPEGGGTGASGNVLHISGLPTANPGPGILWNNAGAVAIGT